MDAISASVIGGTLLSGGVGTPFGTIFGVLIKGTITSLITTQGTLSSWWVRIVLSALLCFFIVLQAIFYPHEEEKTLNIDLSMRRNSGKKYVCTADLNSAPSFRIYST